MVNISSLIILSTMNWLHLIAMLVWLGVLVTNVFFVFPTADAVLRRTLGPAVMGTFAGALAKKARIPAYVSMGVLLITGIVMWMMNGNSKGLFVYGSFWTNVLLLKQLLFIVLVALNIYMMESIVPAIERLAPKGPSAELSKIQQRQVAVGIVIVITLALILAFTALSGAVLAL